MIKVSIFRNEDNLAYGFDVDNHGEKIVCAAVSVLVLNTVNCVENFTNDKFKCNYNNKGGMLRFRMSKDITAESSHDSILLINAMIYGLYGIQDQYKGSLKINEIKDNSNPE